jgi:hypothetical protein
MIRNCPRHPKYIPAEKPTSACLECWALWLAEMMGVSLPPDSGLKNVIIEALDGARQAYLKEHVPRTLIVGLLTIVLCGVQAGARFVPVALDGLANSSTLATIDQKPAAVTRESLQGGGAEPVAINGVPFRFVGDVEFDHVDVGVSLFARRNTVGAPSGIAKETWAGAASKQPGRLQIGGIPSRRYHRLHVIAASDGEPPSRSMFTAMFYRPTAGFPKSFQVHVPLFSDAESPGDGPVPVKLRSGGEARLWHVTMDLDPGQLSSFADLEHMEIELTKGVQMMRSYGDPVYYSTHQAGLPSGVHIYALTLEEPPVDFLIEPIKTAHVFVSPEPVAYRATVTNSSSEAQTTTIQLNTTSYHGTEKLNQTQSITVAAGQKMSAEFKFEPKQFGWHEIRATLSNGSLRWTETRSFANLRPDQRSQQWNGKGPLFGFWGYGDGHDAAPSNDIEMAVMHAAGARACISDRADNRRWRMRRLSSAWTLQHRPPFLPDGPYTEQQLDEYIEAGPMKEYRQQQARAPHDRPDMATFFPEPQLEHRTPPSYYGHKDFELSLDQQRRARVDRVYAEAVARKLRKEFPQMKIYLPWGDPMYLLYMLREGYDPDLFDGCGLDMPHFERLPEQQDRHLSLHRLYILEEELKRMGIRGKEHIFCEGIFVPTEPGACTWSEQMDRHLRWYLISLAYGVKQFYSGAFSFDCRSYYGAEHYGGCGIFSRGPYFAPKPTYTAYATMTAILENAEFDGWLPTGSHSVYCLRFNRGDGRGPVHALWTIRGTREVMIYVDGAATPIVTDSQHNQRAVPIRGRAASVVVGTTPIWLSGLERIGRIELGQPDHRDSHPAEHLTPLSSMADGSWRVDSTRDSSYEQNHWDTVRFAAPLEARIVDSQMRRSKVLEVELPPPAHDPKIMPLYNTLGRAAPITIPGKASALGVWVNGDSSWGRIIYSLLDAKGERWISIGMKDEWNADDVHSWSFFNFDGWRYVRFPLPSHAPYDCFRELETTWWKSEGGDGVVDLPLALEKIIVEMRTHVIYVNTLEPAATPGRVQLADLVAEYASPADQKEDVIRLHQTRMPT